MVQANRSKGWCDRRQRMRLFLVVWMGLLLATCAGTAAAGMVPEALFQKADREGSVWVIVQLRMLTVPEGQLATADAVASQRHDIALMRTAMLGDLPGNSYRTAREFETIPFVALEVGPDALLALGVSPRVVEVQEDRIESLLLSQSVPLVGADQAWASGFDGTGIVVALLDSGVDMTHPFLAGKVAEEACFSFNGSCPNGLTSQIGSGAGVPCTYAPIDCQHGTFVAGIVAGAGASLSGVAKAARVIAVQVFSRFSGSVCAGTGEDPCALTRSSDQIAALERIFGLRTQHSIAAVNMSFGAGTFTSPCDSTETARKAAIDNLRSVGIATVAASGNDASANAMSSPACISTVISVGATTKADVVPSFSNSASFLSFLAPGVFITSSLPGGRFAPFSGTSFAAPHVAGAWAILKQKKPTATVTEVLTALTSSGLPITDPKNGISKPRIRVNQALRTLAAQDFVSRFYQDALGRAPDPTGLAFWVPFLRGQCNPTGFGALADGFFDSFEFRALRPLSLSGLVRVLYRTFLGREPDAVGSAFWADQLRQERLRIALQGFIPSVEFQGLLPDRSNRSAVTSVVTRFYTEVLGRSPDPNGLAFWVNHIIATHDLEGAAVGFLRSPEFEGAARSIRGYLQVLYRTFLGRNPDQVGLAFWEGPLRSNLLGILHQGFIPSEEFQGFVPQVCGT